MGISAHKRDNIQDWGCNAQEMHNEIQDVLGQSFAVPDGLDEDDLLEELDALEDEMANELESGNRAGVPSYLQVRGLITCPTPHSLAFVCFSMQV